MRAFRKALIILVAMLLLPFAAMAPSQVSDNHAYLWPPGYGLFSQLAANSSSKIPEQPGKLMLGDEGQNYEVLLKARRFVPARGISPSLKAALARASPTARTHVLMQLERPLSEEERAELKEQGVELLAYIPHNAWYVSLPAGKISQAAAKPFVRSADMILPDYKISEYIKDGEIAEWAINESGEAVLTVEFHKDVSLDEAEALITAKYGAVYGRIESINALTVAIPSSKIQALASDDAVQWIEEIAPRFAPLLDSARVAIKADYVQSVYGLDGNNIDAFVYEWTPFFGLIEGMVDNTHDDFGARVTRIGIGFAGEHPTHVAGIIGGSGLLSGGVYKGIAPKVRILSNSITIWDYNNPGTVESHYAEAVNNYGADVANNSWGYQPALTTPADCGREGDYESTAQLFDNFVSGSLGRKLPVVFSAGNERGCGDYGCEACGSWGTIIVPSTAKNVITVGAVHSDINAVAWFSSFGPVDDGRIKPDVVAPGCQYSDDFGVTSTIKGDAYGAKCGTSMAAPMVTGSIALMLQRYRALYAGSDPQPSTLKAILANTAKDLYSPGPDYNVGYGMIDVNKAVKIIINRDLNERTISLSGMIDTYDLNLPAGRPELKLTLAWDDYPGTPFAATELVNDLDLIVKAPDGTTYYPWTLNPATPEVGAVNTQEDHTNNIEQVYVANPIAGVWKISVRGTAINQPPQGYSLVGFDLNRAKITSCRIPTNGMVIYSSTTLCLGAYSLPDGITIGADNITLNCSKSTLAGSNAGNGILLESRIGVTIQSCAIKNYTNGIYLSSSNGNAITDSNLVDNQYGIKLYNSVNNSIGGYFAGNAVAGISLDSSNSNMIRSANLKNNGIGIEFIGSSYNRIHPPTITNNATGIKLLGSSANSFSNMRMYWNTNYDFMNNQPNSIYAKNNDWNSTSCPSIDAKIYDNEEGGGTVSFEPFKSGGYIRSCDGNIQGTSCCLVVDANSHGSPYMCISNISETSCFNEYATIGSRIWSDISCGAWSQCNYPEIQIDNYGNCDNCCANIPLQEDSGFNDNLRDLWLCSGDANTADPNLIFTIVQQTNTSMANCVVDSSRYIDCTTQPNMTGYSDVTVHVRDLDGLVGSNTFRVNVVPVNDPPWVSLVIPDQTRNEDAPPWSLDLRPYENDIDDSDLNLDWNVSGVDTSLFTTSFDVNLNIITFKPVANACGPDVITLILRDSNNLTASQNITVTLDCINDLPAAAITLPQNGMTFAPGANITFSGKASDIEDGNLTGASLVWASDINGQIGTGEGFSTSSLLDGNHIITLTATDSQGGTGSASIRLTVAPISGNQPPVIDSYYPASDPVITEEGMQDFNVTASDPNGDTLTIKWYVDANQVATGGSYAYIANYNSSGSHTVRADVSDGNLTTSQQWLLTVLEVCDIPYEGLIIDRNVTFCRRSYGFIDSNKDGAIIIDSNFVTLDCNGAHIYGSGIGKGIVIGGYIPASWFEDGNTNDDLNAVKILTDESGFEGSIAYRQGITIKNCEVSNYDVGLWLRGGSGITITNNIARNNLRAGLGAQGLRGSLISGNTAYNNESGGIVVQAGKNNVIEWNEAYNNKSIGIGSAGHGDLIRYNMVHDNEGGIGIAGADMQVRNNAVRNNSLKEDSAGVISLFSAGAQITGNLVQNSPFGMRLLSSNGMYVADNNVEGSATGIGVGAWIFTQGDMNSGTFERNRMLNSTKAGMHMTDGVFGIGNKFGIHDVVLQGNYFENPGVWDLHLDDRGTSYLWGVRVGAGESIKDMNISGNSFMGGGVQAKPGMNLFCVGGVGNTYDVNAQQAPGECIPEPPVVSDIPDINMNEDTSDSSLDLDDYVSDPDTPDADIIWTASGNANIAVSIDLATHIVTLTPAPDWYGSETITFTASDGALSDSDTSTVTVLPVNDAPVIAGLPDQAMGEDDPIGIPNAFDLDDYASDVDLDPLSYSITASTCAGLISSVAIDADNNVDIGAPLPALSGGCNITVEVSDGFLADNDTFTITVSSVNEPPVVGDWAETIPEDTPTGVNLDPYVADPDNTDAEMTWSVTGTSANVAAVVAGNILTITPAADFCGAGESVAVQATDPLGLSDSGTITVDVTCVNDAPTAAITSPADGNAFDQGTAITFTGTATDVEDGTLTGSALVWTSNIDGVIGAGESFTTSLSVGTHTITLTATDSQGTAGSSSIILTVSCYGIVETRVTTNTANQTYPDIYGNRIVWEDTRDGNYDIYMYDLDTNTETRITTNTANQRNSAIYGNKIVWDDYRNGLSDIYMYDLDTNTERQITTNTATQRTSAIYGNKIVWFDTRDGKYEIYIYDLDTNTERQITTNTSYQDYPAIHSNKIVWEDYRNGNYDIYIYDLDTNTERQITTNTANQWYPDIYGNKIVWDDNRSGNWDIYMYDLDTNTETSIATNTAAQYWPAIYGNRIVWYDNRNVNTDIYMYNLSTSTETQITTNTAVQVYPAIYGNRIIWADGRNGNWDIYMATDLCGG